MCLHSRLIRWFVCPVLPESWSSTSLFGVFTPFDNFGVKAMAILLIIVLSYVNYRGLKLGEGVSRIVLLIVVPAFF